jgi:hypothetical protein
MLLVRNPPSHHFPSTNPFLSPQFASETGSQGQWRTPSAGEVASDFDDFNADGSVKEGVYDATKKADDDDVEEEVPKGRKAKKVAAE